MPIKNPIDFLMGAARFPAAIEAKLPEGAPKISSTLSDIAGKIPVLPDLPIELPDLPAPPEIPEIPLPGLRRYVTGVEVTPAGEPAKAVPMTPAREKVPLVFE